jgi:hypothetical protein
LQNDVQHQKDALIFYHHENDDDAVNAVNNRLIIQIVHYLIININKWN